MAIIFGVAVAVVLLVVFACLKMAAICDEEEEKRFHQRCRDRAEAGGTEDSNGVDEQCPHKKGGA